jgi:hypothetical protein
MLGIVRNTISVVIPCQSVAEALVSAMAALAVTPPGDIEFGVEVRIVVQGHLAHSSRYDPQTAVASAARRKRRFTACS